MNIPAFDGSFMLDDFAEITQTVDPFWLGVHRDNVEGWMQINYSPFNLCVIFKTAGYTIETIPRKTNWLTGIRNSLQNSMKIWIGEMLFLAM